MSPSDSRRASVTQMHCTPHRSKQSIARLHLQLRAGAKEAMTVGGHTPVKGVGEAAVEGLEVHVALPVVPLVGGEIAEQVARTVAPKDGLPRRQQARCVLCVRLA